jgi:hypothetical protein
VLSGTKRKASRPALPHGRVDGGDGIEQSAVEAEQDTQFAGRKGPGWPCPGLGVARGDRTRWQRVRTLSAPTRTQEERTHRTERSAAYARR